MARRWCFAPTRTPRSATSSISSPPNGAISGVSLIDRADEGLIVHGWPDVFLSVQSRKFDRLGREILVRNHREKVANDIEPGAFLVVRVHDIPGNLLQVRVGEH